VSIIYNALKKTQTVQESTATTSIPTPSQPKRSHSVLLHTLGLIGVSILALLVSYFFMRHFHHSKPVVVAEKHPVLVLNGVMLSPQDKIAIINNREYHIGDQLAGMKIINMDMNSVVLQNKSGKYTLRTG